MPVRIEDRDEIISRINRKYDEAIHQGNEYPDIHGISTSSPELDAAMGGGVPIGHWVRFYGGFGSTKTMTSLCVAGNAQRMGQTVALYNAEKRYEPTFAERLGVNTEELTVVPGTTIEEIGDKMESMFGVCHLHIIDSASICVSEDELNADIRDWRPGISARAWGKVFRRLNERFDSRENTVIIIDQMRKNFKTGGEDPAGGMVFDHQSSMSVLFWSGAWLFRDENGILEAKPKEKEKGLNQELAHPAGREIKIRVEKSSVCRPFRTAVLHYDLDSLEYDRVFEFVKAAKHYEIVTTTGRGRYEYEGTKMHGDKQLREFIAGDKKLQEKIRKTVLEAGRR